MPVRRLLPTALAALTLTACSSDAPLADAPAAPSPGTPAPVAAAAPPPELGDFDPEGDFEVFNPCTEIPAEVRAAAGLGEPVRDTAYDGDRSVLCSYSPLDESLQGIYTLTGDKVPLTRIEERGLLISPTVKSTVPGVYLHHMGLEGSGDCSAAVHTDRGRFIVQYVETLPTQQREAICALAIEKLENIYHDLGETNGDVHQS